MIRCKCGKRMKLTYGGIEQECHGIRFQLRDAPIFECRECGTRQLPEGVHPLIIEWAEKARSDGSKIVEAVIPRLSIPSRFVATAVAFLYDINDYYFLPGLYRPSNDGFLTPVFFDIRVLDKYAHDDRYRLEIVAESMGVVSADRLQIRFGINECDLVIMWLGDIAKLGAEEQYYLRSYNVHSDHDIDSDFYGAEIDIEFTAPSGERSLLQSRSRVNDAAQSVLGKPIFDTDVEIIRHARQVHRPSVYTRDNVCRSISALTRLFVEAVNCDLVRNIILAKNAGAALDGLGSIKLLEKLVEQGSSMEAAGRKMTGMYVLYDWRITCEHGMPRRSLESKLAGCASRLGVAFDAANEASTLRSMYQALLLSLTEAIDTIAGCFAVPDS